MKKYIITALLAGAVIVSCQKFPSVVDRDGEFLVSTSYDKDADFSKYATFSVADSILVLDSHLGGDMVKSNFTDALTNDFKEAMEACGYEYLPIEEKDNADIGIQLTYLYDTDYIVDYVDPYWWLDYPGYWSARYWGAWSGWYYPYPVMYEFSTHSLMAEMADLTAEDNEEERLPVVWSCLINGNSGSARADLARFETAIRQAFTQSPYLHRVSE